MSTKIPHTNTLPTGQAGLLNRRGGKLEVRKRRSSK